jgi:hypothetical protein
VSLYAYEKVDSPAADAEQRFQRADRTVPRRHTGELSLTKGRSSYRQNLTDSADLEDSRSRASRDWMSMRS